MANSIALAQAYLPMLDEVYKRSALTVDLDNNGVQFVNANTVKLFKTEMDGLGNYNRNTGFVDGSVTGTWETLTLSQDRGRSFMIDRMDNEETINQAFGTLAGQFLRTHVVPEIDAYRFAQMAGASGILTASATFSAEAHNVAEAIDAAEEQMNNAEVPVEGRILYISENAYKYLKGDVNRTLANENDVNTGFVTYNTMKVVRVPVGRFNSAITLHDGATDGQAKGGFTASGKAINFMIVHPSAVAAVVKHTLPRIFTPEVNQTADAWKFDYRIYHDLFVMENKVKGIYLHTAS